MTEGAGTILNSGIQIIPDAGKYLAEHFRREDTGIGVVARAVIAGKQSQPIELMLAGMFERRR